MKERYIFALILAAVSLSYYNALSVGFVSDDRPQILFNPDIKSWSNIITIFTSGVWKAEGFSGALYRPLAFLSWMSEYSVAGTNPFLYHLDNVLLHIASTFMIYIIIKKLYPDPMVGAFTALIFAAHPVHTEAVTWIACRMELMYSLFTLLALWVFIAKPRTTRYIILACALFMMGLLSKETAIVLPLLILAYVLLYEKNALGHARIKMVIILLLPYAATAALYAAIRMTVIGTAAPGITYLYTNYDNIGAYNMFLTMCQALYEYVRLSFLPFDQRLEYVFRPPASFLSLKVFAALSAVSLFIIYFRKLTRVSKTACFAILWFFICLLPVSNIIPAGIIMTERAAYLPSLGPCLLLGLALTKADMHGRSAVRYGTLFLAVVMTVFIYASHIRNKVWAGIDPNTVVQLMAGRVNAFPDNPVNYSLLAQAKYDAGDYSSKTEETVQTGLRMTPDDDVLHFLYARLLYKQDRLNESLGSVKKAISIRQEAGYYDFAGGVLQKLGRNIEASGMFEEAIRLSPDISGYRVNMGNLLLEAGEDDRALAVFTKAVELDPANPDAYLGMGIALDALGDTEKAVAFVKKAVELSPESPDLRYFMANAYLRAGRRELAAAELREALRLKPDYAEAAGLLESIE